MVDVVGDDLTIGDYIKWYLGGVETSFTHTVTEEEVTATIVALPTSAKAALGSLIITVDGVPTPAVNYYLLEEVKTPSTDASGCTHYGYTGITAGDVIEGYFVDISSTTLTHNATCDKVSPSKSADRKSYSVFGQKNKINITGTPENSVTMSGLFYDQTFRAAVFGDQITGSPATGKTQFTDKFNGFQTIGALVGKKYNSSGVLVQLIYLVGVQASSFNEDHTAGAEASTESADFSVQYRVEVDLS